MLNWFDKYLKRGWYIGFSRVVKKVNYD
jgi:hypothetical protein